MVKSVARSLFPGRSKFFHRVISMQVYWSPFHPSAKVAKEFINRFLGPKFRRNFPDLEAEHHFWKEPNRRAMFVLHIDNETKEGYKFSAEVPDGFTYHEFEDLLMRERRVIETDSLREELWSEAQKPQDEEDEEGGYAGPSEIEIELDYSSFKKE